MCIYERKLYNAVYMEETCLNLTPNTLESECILVTFSCIDEKFVLLQLTRSVSFKTLCIETNILQIFICIYETKQCKALYVE